MADSIIAVRDIRDSEERREEELARRYERDFDRKATNSITAVRDLRDSEERREEELARRYERRRTPGGWLASARTSMGSVDDDLLTQRQLLVRRIISSWKFDAVIGVCICFNAITIGVETTYSARRDPVPLWVTIADQVLLMVYTVELLLRFYVDKFEIFNSKWVRFDLLLVCSGFLDLIVKVVLSSETPDALANVMLVRMLRLARLARAARLLIQFKVLWLLVQGLMNSYLTIFWTFVIILVLIYIFAIVGMEVFRPDEDAGEAYQEAAQLFNEGLGHSMLVLVQFLTLDSIGHIYIPICLAKPLLTVYFVVFILVVSVAMMNLVTALMVDAAMSQSSQDREAEKAWESANKKKALPRLKAMFEELDTDGSGCLELDEIRNAPEELRQQLQVIANLEDVEELFHTLDFDQSGTVEVDEFCDGVLKVARDKKPLELLRLVRQCGSIQKNSHATLKVVESIKAAMSSHEARPKTFSETRPKTVVSVGSSNTTEEPTRVTASTSTCASATTPSGAEHQPLPGIEDRLRGLEQRVGGTPSGSGRVSTPSGSRQLPSGVGDRLTGMEQRIAGMEASLRHLADAGDARYAGVQGRMSGLERRFAGLEASIQRIADAVGAPR